MPSFTENLFDKLRMYLPTERSSTNMSQATTILQTISLDAAGLVALADLNTIAKRTALTGTSKFLDALVLAPGLHRQQNSPELNKGEFPACAALTSGYVFRVENPATVLFLQKVGKTGCLTTLKVSKKKTGWRWTSTLGGTMAYIGTVFLSLAVLSCVVVLRDWWGVAVLGLLILCRLLNVIVIRQRSVPGWFGAKEPGVKGDVLVLLSQDRWIRLQGDVDDLKAATSGQWLQEPTFFQSSMVAFATLLVYLDAALAGNASQTSKLLLLILLFGSVALLGIANECTQVLQMHGRVVEVVGLPKAYPRRLALAEELILETGRKDWAVRLGMVQPDHNIESEKKLDGIATM
ncbi:hypothetical protein AC578_3884 [Pseudocercospora eumusae]|uniref:Uncharacterized protein n=1 Tax=Pseudocercospora eumusae TaxID=321146 RepID=A0A139GXX1_9PEZI|nr:hypothetical protein AC578_3884 [Pseudocercospora eumusae]